jgi:uncharacterized protein
MEKAKLFNLNSDDPKFRAILSRYKVNRISLFGSFASGEETGSSDLDFLVEFDKEADLLDQVGLKLDLEEFLGRKVDVVTPNSISNYIRDSVQKQALPL